jgi:enamine deaminase RidA (YjgF/YER057c/UK114 family)
MATTVRAVFDDDTRWQLSAPRDILGPVLATVARRRRYRALAAAAGTLAVAVAIVSGVTGWAHTSTVDPASRTAQVEISQARQALTTALAARARSQSNGGADRVHIASAHQHADVVDIAGTYRAWSGVVSQTNPNGTIVTAQPSSLIDFTATMTRDSHGTWSMTNYNWNFHPGSEP